MTAGRSAYSPSYRLRINGDDLPASVRSHVMSIRYEDGLEGSDQVQMTLANPGLKFLKSHIRGMSAVAPPSGVGLNTFAESGTEFALFDLDNEVELAMGYDPDPPRDMFLGEITGVSANFPNGGMPTLTVTAHDFLQRTTRGTASRGFWPLPDAPIVSILALENALIPLIEPSILPLDAINMVGNFLFGTSTKQVKSSDFKLLTEIAERYDMQLSVEGRFLFLKRFAKEYSPRMTLTYGRSLMEFAPRVTSVGEALGMTQRVTLREIRVDLILKVFWDLDRERIGFAVLPAEAAKVAPAIGAPTKESKYPAIRNALDVANALVGLLRELRAKLNGRLTAEGVAVGDPMLRAGAVIDVQGVGYDFSGHYRVTKAVHTLDESGYRTRFQARREVIP